MNINKNLGLKAKVEIMFHSSIKLLRGLFARPFFANVNGPVLIGKKATLLNKSYITVGRWTKFEDYCEVQGLSQGGLHFGDYVTIGRNVSIRPSSYYGVGHIGIGLKMGNRSSIGPNGWIGAAGEIKIGSDVMIGPGVMMIAENHIFKEKNTSIKEQGVKQSGITIEDNVWIGSNVTILDGVHIGKNSVIGAGTLLTKDIPEDSVVYDTRQRFVRNR